MLFERRSFSCTIPYYHICLSPLGCLKRAPTKISKIDKNWAKIDKSTNQRRTGVVEAWKYVFWKLDIFDLGGSRENFLPQKLGFSIFFLFFSLVKYIFGLPKINNCAQKALSRRLFGLKLGALRTRLSPMYGKLVHMVLKHLVRPVGPSVHDPKSGPKT